MYFPVTTISNLTSNNEWYTAYNGVNFYYQENRYGTNFSSNDFEYSSVILKDAENGDTRPEDLIEFSYNELCFAVDYFYGRPGREVLHDSLAEYGLEKSLQNLGAAGEKIIELLHSGSYAEYFAGISRLQIFLENGGHTAVENISNSRVLYSKLNEQYEAVNSGLDSLFEEYSANTEKKELSEDMRIARMAQREEILNCGDSTYVKRGDTAICILDGFGVKIYDVWKDYYEGKTEKPTLENLAEGLKPDPVLKVTDAIKRASADPEVKNLIVDISNNGGGDTDECTAVIALLTGSRLVTTYAKNMYTGVVAKLVTEVDCNLDGVFDEKDNIDHGLNIGVLTSSYSYSCGTLFPMYMKELGYPTLGEQSGGGACCIETLSSAEGFVYQLSSGVIAYSDSTGTVYDAGMPVDISLYLRNEDYSVKEITLTVP